MTFNLGSDEETELTEAQVLQQCKMYIAAVRIAAEFGAADHRHPVPAGAQGPRARFRSRRGPAQQRQAAAGLSTRVTGKELFKGEALPHFNEVDECAGLDGVVTYKLWRELGYPPENTLHDLRWGRHYKDENLDAYVWVFLISGAAPPAHFIGGLQGHDERTPARDVLPARRRHGQGHQQAGLDRLEPRLRRRAASSSSTPAWPKSSSCRRPKPRSAGNSPRRSGRSCTPCCRAFRATR